MTTYVPLARRLQERPVYGLQSVGLQGESWPLADVRAMARRYLPEILAKDPTGPCLLAATCMGGLVAFELAQMLVQQGKKVGFLGLMDSHFPLPLTWHESSWRKIYVSVRTPLHANWRIIALENHPRPRAGTNRPLAARLPEFYCQPEWECQPLLPADPLPRRTPLFITTETRFARGDPRLMMYPLARTAPRHQITRQAFRIVYEARRGAELARQLQSALELADKKGKAVIHPRRPIPKIAGNWNRPVRLIEIISASCNMRF